MLPGDYFIWVSRCDLVLEDDVIFILLKMKDNQIWKGINCYYQPVKMSIVK